MRKQVLLLLVACLLLSPISSAISCLSSSDDYASEVVVYDYDLFSLRKIADREGSIYYIEPQYGNNLIGIAKETNFPEGLSVRLQIPTKITEIRSPYFKLTSTLNNKQLNEIKTNSIVGWNVDCQSDVCVFTEGEEKLILKQISTDIEATLEITDELNSCEEGCRGTCIATSREDKCIESKTRSDLSTILKFSGAAQQFEELLESYQVAGSSEIILSDIVPSFNPYINWQEAIRQELVYLNSKGAISLSREDIESIALLAKKGQAGQNKRIVFDAEKREWMYYEETPAPVITSQTECIEYQKLTHNSSPITGNIIGITKNPFYLVPLIILVAGMIALIILVLIARAITSRQKVYSDNLKLT